MILKFTIRGNQEDPEGNPIGFKRVLKGSWNAAATRYMEWQQYVRSELLRKFEYQVNAKDEDLTLENVGHPIVLKKDQKVQVEIKVFWKNHAHSDLDNVLKGILDSIFKDDKGVNGIRAEYQMAPDKKGRVDVTIKI